MKENLQKAFVKHGLFTLLNTGSIGVFGSYARGEKYNDIDILLDTDPGYKKREILKQIIEKEMHVPCDVLVKNMVEPIILFYLEKDLVYVEKP